MQIVFAHQAFIKHGTWQFASDKNELNQIFLTFKKPRSIHGKNELNLRKDRLQKISSKFKKSQS